MSDQNKDFSLPNYNAITAYQNNLSSLNGIFSFLFNLNGKYQSRYDLIGPSLSDGYTISNLDQYFTKGNQSPFVSDNGVYNFTIKFKSLFFMTGYSLINCNKDNGNTHPTAWKIYGVHGNTKHLLDKQENQVFCSSSSSSGYCSQQTIKGYKIKETKKAYKEFLFEQTGQNEGNSDNKDYIIIDSMDLFGTLCGIDQKCHLMYYSCIIKKNNNALVFAVISLFVFKQ